VSRARSPFEKALKSRFGLYTTFARLPLNFSPLFFSPEQVSEAIHKGIPVVATRAGGIPLQVRDGVDGKLVEPGNRTAIADAIYDLYFKHHEGGVVPANQDEFAVTKPFGGRWRSDDEHKLPSEEFMTIGNMVCVFLFAVPLSGGFSYIHSLSGLFFLLWNW
jgi:hypothetical protein